MEMDASLVSKAFLGCVNGGRRGDERRVRGCVDGVRGCVNGGKGGGYEWR